MSDIVERLRRRRRAVIKPEMIPVEASWAILKAWNGCECEVCCAVAIAAALKAWQGAYTVPMGYPATDIVLPLKKSEAV